MNSLRGRPVFIVIFPNFGQLSHLGCNSIALKIVLEVKIKSIKGGSIFFPSLDGNSISNNTN